MQVVLIILGFVAGFAIAFIIFNSKIASARREQDEKFREADKERSILVDRLEQKSRAFLASEESLAGERKTVIELNSLLSAQKTISDNFREKLDNQKKEIEDIHKRFTMEFENLSSKILEEKSQKFTEQNKSNLFNILNPLQEKIKEFEQKVDLSYKTEAAERNSLKGEIKSLVELNKQISEEANNLAKALKGDTKQQGNWGEFILEKILERSGLTRGSEYELQFSTSNDEGKRIQPDVIINLPENKHIIIDSKVSLVAYEAMANASSEEEKEKHLKEHIASVRSHIRYLSEKNYHTSQDISSLEFVLIFMPIEPSFAIAVQSDAELFNFAWERKIILVSPSTLLATLKTISSIWKNEKQTRNAQEIARISGTLYDKFFNFIKDMNNIGDKIGAAQDSYQDAMNKLTTGSGNIVKKIEELKRLGAKSNKELPQDLLERAEENDAAQNF